MNILALDTSTEACSVALLCADHKVVERFEIAPRAHTRLLPKMLESVVLEAGIERTEITHVTYTNGPGAFTGVRIGTATAQGLAMGLKADLLPISTLAVVARQCYLQTGQGKIVASLDARMGEAYVGYYSIDPLGLPRAEMPEQLIRLDLLSLPQGYHAAGSGFGAAVSLGFYSGAVDHIHSQIWPTSSALLDLARDALTRSPHRTVETAINYIRNKVAEKKRPTA